MARGTRVHELAKSYGITSRQLLGELREMGEFVTSASSTLEPPVVRRVEERLGRPRDDAAPAGTAASSVASGHARRTWEPRRPAARPVRHRDADDQFRIPPPRPKYRPFEWWRGDPPIGLTKYLLDHWVVQMRDPGDPLPERPYFYFAREVEQAQKEASRWATNLLDGWRFEDILDWVGSSVDPAQAVQIRAAGVARGELGWHYEDHGRGDLAWRLAMGSWTVQEVITEAIARRDRA